MPDNRDARAALRCEMAELQRADSPDLLSGSVQLRLLTAAEVAERLRVPVSWVRRHGAELPGLVRLGKYIRWNSARLDEFIAAGGLG